MTLFWAEFKTRDTKKDLSYPVKQPKKNFWQQKTTSGQPAAVSRPSAANDRGQDHGRKAIADRTDGQEVGQGAAGEEAAGEGAEVSGAARQPSQRRRSAPRSPPSQLHRGHDGTPARAWVGNTGQLLAAKRQPAAADTVRERIPIGFGHRPSTDSNQTGWRVQTRSAAETAASDLLTAPGPTTGGGRGGGATRLRSVIHT